MRRQDLIVAVLCIATSALVLVLSVPHYYGTWGTLGAGAYPAYIAPILAICGISIFIQFFLRDRKEDEPPFFPRGRKRTLLLFAAGSLVAHRFATDLFGFGLASLLLMIFLMRLLGNYRWRTILPVSILFVGAVSYLFREWLYMDLPRGFLGY